MWFLTSLFLFLKLEAFSCYYFEVLVLQSSICRVCYFSSLSCSFRCILVFYFNFPCVVSSGSFLLSVLVSLSHCSAQFWLCVSYVFIFAF